STELKIRKKGFAISDQNISIKRNLAIMWSANFFIARSMTVILPFLSLHINTFGNFSSSCVQTWSGLTFGVTFVTAFLFSPIWGRIGDKYGRKKILMMSALGLGISLLLMGFATSVWELFFLRLFMGIFTGFIPMSQALIATQTPKKVAGSVLGTLQTGSITGMRMGPLSGGTIADAVGYAATFKHFSISILLSGIIVTFGIKQVKLQTSEVAETKSYSSKEVLRHIFKKPVLLVTMLLAAVIQIAHFSIQPILSLYVAEMNGTANIAFFSGMAFSAAGLGNLLMTKRWGKLGGRVGYMKIGRASRREGGRASTGNEVETLLEFRRVLFGSRYDATGCGYPNRTFQHPADSITVRCGNEWYSKYRVFLRDGFLRSRTRKFINDKTLGEARRSSRLYENINHPAVHGRHCLFTRSIRHQHLATNSNTVFIRRFYRGYCSAPHCLYSPGSATFHAR